MYVCIYVKKISQGDFRLMSFTAGRCSTPLIPNDQLRRNGVRSSDLIPNDQLRRNGVRSSNLIVCVRNVPSEPKADRDEPRSADQRSESAGVGPKALYEPNRSGRSVRL